MPTIENTRADKIRWVQSHKDYDKISIAFEQFDPYKTYGGPSSFGDALVPDKIMGLDCSGIFYFHDGRFEVGGDEKDFNRANRLMLTELLEWIDKKDWWAWGTNWLMRSLAKKIAYKYYDAVCFGGKLSFNFKGEGRR